MGPAVKPRFDGNVHGVAVQAMKNIPASGAYLLKVRADGDWVISSTQLTGTYSSPPATQQWQGHGSFVTPLFSLKSGALRISGSHTNGTRNFIVELLDQNGETVELIANEIGPATINTIENVSTNGVYLLYIRADGDWTITLQQ